MSTKKENLKKKMQSPSRGVLSVIDTEPEQTQNTPSIQQGAATDDLLTQLSNMTSVRESDGRKGNGGHNTIRNTAKTSTKSTKTGVLDGDIRQTFILSEELNDKIHAISDRDGIKLKFIINKSLQWYVDTYEEKENVTITWKEGEGATINGKEEKCL